MVENLGRRLSEAHAYMCVKPRGMNRDLFIAERRLDSSVHTLIPYLIGFLTKRIYLSFQYSLMYIQDFHYFRIHAEIYQECIKMSKTYKQSPPNSLPNAFPTLPNV